MRASDVPQVRLHHQGLTTPQFTEPAKVVKWLGAVQAQDYAGGKWAIAQRMRHATDDGIEKAFAQGSILRTHVLRPTWHFVAPDDIRWLLQLTAPRVKASIASYCRANSLDDAAFKRSHRVLATALRGGRQLTRGALRQAVQRAGMATEGIRFILMLMRAELDGLICSGARIGKQFTYTLLEERAPRSKVLTRDEALSELTRRYFTSRGPATLQDYVWWSGLTASGARAGLEMAGRQLTREVIDGRTCCYTQPKTAVAHS
jgi:hypothetical protein